MKRMHLRPQNTWDRLGLSLGFGVEGVGLWGFPKIRGTILGVPVMRIIIYWGIYRGPLI